MSPKSWHMFVHNGIYTSQYNWKTATTKTSISGTLLRWKVNIDGENDTATKTTFQVHFLRQDTTKTVKQCANNTPLRYVSEQQRPKITRAWYKREKQMKQNAKTQRDMVSTKPTKSVRVTQQTRQLVSNSHCTLNSVKKTIKSAISTNFPQRFDIVMLGGRKDSRP